MKRSLLNIIVDATSLVIFVTMISTGLLLKFILPPGSGRVEMLLRGGGRYEKSIDLFMGLTRHEWGTIHFFISLAFLILLIVHLILHWNWIKAVTFGTPQSPQPFFRKALTVGIALFVITALLFPWVVNKRTYTKSEFFQMRNLRNNY